MLIALICYNSISELKVDERQYVEDRKFYDKFRRREVQWQRKLQFMTKEGENVADQHDFYNTMQGKSGKLAGTSNEDWEEMDLKAARTIQLCLANEVMYNVMDEETTT